MTLDALIREACLKGVTYISIDMSSVTRAGTWKKHDRYITAYDADPVAAITAALNEAMGKANDLSDLLT